MTVIVTMAGAGSRFRDFGYIVPKHMIYAKGESLFEWSMKSLNLFKSQPFVFATLAEHDSDWVRFTATKIGISQSTVINRDALSRGQAETAYDVLHAVADEEPLWIYNIDTYITNGLSPSDLLGYDGCVPIFHSNQPNMSYVKHDNFGRVIELAEKKIISEWATVGVYGFARASLFRELYYKGYELDLLPLVKGERYVAPLYQLMLDLHGTVSSPKITRTSVHVLGTPDEIKIFDPLALPPRGNLIFIQ